MATVKEVVTDALGGILQNKGEEPIEAEDGQIVIRGLNDMMTMFAANGINLGFTVVSSMGDEVTVPDGALAGIKANLGIFVAPDFKAEVSSSLLQKAKEGMKAIRNLTVNTLERGYPDILPQGSGNTGQSFSDDTFYSEGDARVELETGGAIGLEEDTEA